ncbi:MAG TPA: host attachment protein [Burkholderiaceae bacterium]|jgi:protein required for attachment to host cells
MQTIWILAADNSRVRVFQELDHEHHLQEIQDFANPAGHASGRELETDSKGRYYGKGERSQAHTAEPDVDPIQHENELFSKEIGEFLDKARNEHRYDKLHVIAPPKFLGLLRKNLNKETQKLVGEEIVKDISWQGKHEIEAFVRTRKL